MAYVIQVCWQLASRIRTEPVPYDICYCCADSLRAGSGRNQLRPDPAPKLSGNLYDICHCCADSLRAGSGRNWFLPDPALWHIPLLCVQWKTPDDGQMNCPKHVEFYSKNKLEKLVHLVGFIIRMQETIGGGGWGWRDSVRTIIAIVDVNGGNVFDLLTDRVYTLMQHHWFRVSEGLSCFVCQQLDYRKRLSNSKTVMFSC